MDAGAKTSMKDSIATRMLVVVLGLYLLIAMGGMVGQVCMEYRYQKANILHDLGDIEGAFENGLAVSLWGLDEAALNASVEGMLRIPTLVGVKVRTAEGLTIAIGGIVSAHGKTGNVGFHVNLSGLSDAETAVRKSYNHEMFERQFPIVYDLKGESILLGRATIYSNSAVIYRRMKLQTVMLAVNVLLILATFFLALLWAVNRYLRRPLAFLASAVQKVSLENLDSFRVRIGLSGRNELTVLEESFNLMIGNLHQSMVKREQAEENLAAEKERLAVTLRSIGDGVITTDISGKIVMLNKVAEKLTGWSNGKAVGRPLGAVFHIISEQTRKVCENPVAKVIDNGRIVGLANHTVLVARDGTERSIADSGAPILDAQSNIAGVVLVFRDVTEQIKMEKNLLKVKKLESIGVLAGGIAHDFNNILAAILGNISLALFDADLKDDTRQLLSEAENASIRAKDLTQQLLTFAKGGEPVKEASSLESVIKDSANFVLHGDKVACRFDIPEDLWIVDIDKGQISQVIQNIVLNASHAMPEGGIIQIACENLSSEDGDVLPLAIDGRVVKICIRDSGIGMPANVVEKIFDPYFSTKQDGSGLGLAITHSIISKHGGHVSVESSSGIGTVFSLYLPASTRSCIAGSPAETIEPAVIKARILIVDDEEQIRNMSQAMLRRMGHEVVLARDGAEAIRIYKESTDCDSLIDLVIMDLTIPGGMGGEDAVRKILAINPHAKVIVSSGYSNDPVMASFREFGFCGAIGKPYHLNDLRKVITKVLREPGEAET